MNVTNQGTKKRVVYFFTANSPQGIETFGIVSKSNPAFTWRLIHIENPTERKTFESEMHKPDIIISFLNPYILKPPLLDSAGNQAYNVHPALPGYPGRDPQHFAYYDKSESNGATLHRITSMVDSGEVLAVIEEPVDRALGVMSFIRRSEELAKDLLVAELPKILDGSIARSTDKTWRDGAPTTRKQFLEMCRIDATMALSEITHRLESFYNPNYRSIYVELHGFRFVYEPSPDSCE